MAAAKIGKAEVRIGEPRIRRLIPVYIFSLTLGFVMGIMTAILPIYVRGKGVPVSDWAFMFSLFYAGMLLSEMPWGIVSDRIGRRTVLSLVPLANAAVISLYISASWIMVFYLLQLSRGIIVVANGPSQRALVSELAPPRSLGIAIGLLFASGAAGQMVGNLLGPIFAIVWGYESSFYLASAASILGAVVAVGFLREPGQRRGTKHGKVVPLLSRISRERSFQSVFLLAPILMIQGTLILAFLPVFAIDIFGASTLDVGVALALYTSTLAIVTPFGGRLSDRIGRWTAVMAGLGIGIAASTIYSLVEIFPLILLATLMMGVSYALIVPSLLALLTDISRREFYGTSMGLFGSFEDIGMILGPIFYGFAWSFLGSRSIFYVCIVVQLVGILVATLASRASRRGFPQPYFEKVSGRSSP